MQWLGRVAAIVLSTINAKWIHPSLALRLLKANLPPDLPADDCAILEFALRQPLAEKTAAILAQAPKILALSVSVWNHDATLELLGALEDAGLFADGTCKKSIFRKDHHAEARRSQRKKNLVVPYNIKNYDFFFHSSLRPLRLCVNLFLKVFLQKNHRRSVKPVIVLGGPEITGLMQDSAVPIFEMQDGNVPALFRYADFVIGGEGEAVFAELCRAVLQDPVAAKKQFYKYIETSPIPLTAIKDAYDLYSDEDLHRKLIYVESSRGCPYTCAFCQSAVDAGGNNSQNAALHPVREFSVQESPVREFPVKEFLDNLDKLLRRCSDGNTDSPVKTRTIKFLDRSFNVNIPRALRILEFCLAKTAQPEFQNKLQFHFEMVPAVFPEELRNMLALFPPGSLRLEIGIQSFNPQSCALIKRNSNPERELETIKFLRGKTNAVIHADLIAGLPAEDINSFGSGFDRLWIALTENVHPKIPRGGAEIAEKEKFEIQPGILKCLPGTPIRAMAEAGSFAVRYSNTPPYEVIETDCLPVADMERIKNFARFWELIVNRQSPLLPLAAPPGRPVFTRFMELSQKLLDRFGKNWGIPKDALEEALITACTARVD